MRCAAALVLMAGVMGAAPQALASCLNAAADSRLQLLCLTDQAAGRGVGLRSAQLIDQRLKHEGYARGLGLDGLGLNGPLDGPLDGPVGGPVGGHRPQVRLAPLLEWSSNINGGNPDKPLVVAGLTFAPDPALVATRGLVAGLGADVGGRSLLGPGRYVDYALGGSIAASGRHDQTIRRAHARLCVKTRLAGPWHADLCAAADQTRRVLKVDSAQALTLAGTRLAGGGGRYHLVSAGLRREWQRDHAQTRLVATLETLRAGGAFTSLSATLGQPVADHLALRQGLAATLGTAFNRRALRVTVSYAHSDGGRVLGQRRADTTKAVSLAYAAHPRLWITLGYRTTASSLGHYSAAEPTFGAELAPWRF